ncbi:ThiS family protein [Pseudobythopirellula maris]|uniref:Molybdopterin synthase sulfur carrier subunit n=1 Tax=Pseudobythopirellula maris TaxID=2527991 RepID=A0A5C5ZSD9_9BACT|nr:MoaD/ThiS family protein [Pseudobythopirellula maris]TWT90462.1 ThiS family protein [Pseudobythopirellula maris]
MKIRVLLFAGAREAAGADSIDVELADNAVVGDVRRAIADQTPQLASLAERSRISVGAAYATDSDPAPPDAEFALIPPVSGG